MISLTNKKRVKAEKTEIINAAMISEDQIRYTINSVVHDASISDVKLHQGGRELQIISLSTPGKILKEGAIITKEKMDLTLPYTLSINSSETKTVIPMQIFDSIQFVENYTYSGNDLGATVYGNHTVFKIWAPTASEVILNLYENGNEVKAFFSTQMHKKEYGIWEYTADCGHGTYYTFTVKTAFGTRETVDPYAKSTGVNGERGMVVDLPLTDPEGFREEDRFIKLNSYQDAVIWEVHIRDFSVDDAMSSHPGKYLAFTETGHKNAAGVPVGMDHLKRLGITHIHLQPVFDFATVNEQDPTGEYNWGYDPKNYNVPEGSYATDPYNGVVRIREFKQMVQAIHRQGMGIIMDVVYNHTAETNSALNKTVPYYYYRHTQTGDDSNGSGCGNETASERIMMRKYIIDSVLYWAKEYHVDGFRFDLMGLHDIETMQETEEELHKLNPCAIIYGEGWTGGRSPLNTERQCILANISRLKATQGSAGGVAVFNDAIRDGLKGSVFDTKECGYISGAANESNASRVIHGLTGGKSEQFAGWRANDYGVINYMSCHDNLTLFDKLRLSRPDADTEQLIAMNQLGAAVVFLAKGTPFMLAGEEMLRTKKGDENSYCSPDSINRIDWEALLPGSAQYRMYEYYRMLINLRKQKTYLRRADVSCSVTDAMCIGITYSIDKCIVAFAVLNPDQNAQNITIPGGDYRYVYGGEGKLREHVTVKAMSWILIEKI